jgi:predicted RNase H-like nuclease (RuvC/YqgF family)
MISNPALQAPMSMMYYPQPQAPYIPPPKSTAQKLLEDFDKDAAPVIDMDAIMEKIDVQMDTLRKELFGRFASVKQFESLEHRLIGKMDEEQRQTDVCRDDILAVKNSISSHNWDINELKTMIFELKDGMAGVQANLKSLEDDYFAKTYDIDIDALYKKAQTLERDLRDKLDCDVFDKELQSVKALALQSQQLSASML